MTEPTTTPEFDLDAHLAECRARMAEFGLAPKHSGVKLLEPLGYLEMVGLVEQATLVLTDSGGVNWEIP